MFACLYLCVQNDYITILRVRVSLSFPNAFHYCSSRSSEGSYLNRIGIPLENFISDEDSQYLFQLSWRV
jgi:hypothetical protein